MTADRTWLIKLHIATLYVRHASLQGSVKACEKGLSFSNRNYHPGVFHMTSKLIFFLVAAILAVSAGPLAAGEHPEHSVENHMVIALATDDFELAETDISDLEIGDAETIYTESGKTIDLLRTAEGVEIYVDGELLETGLESGVGVHDGHHAVHKHVEVVCDTD